MIDAQRQDQSLKQFRQHKEQSGGVFHYSNQLLYNAWKRPKKEDDTAAHALHQLHGGSSLTILPGSTSRAPQKEEDHDHGLPHGPFLLGQAQTRCNGHVSMMPDMPEDGQT